MLRSGELCSLTQGHLIVDDDDDNFYGFSIVATEQPKTKYTAGRVQHVLTTCAWVSFYLSRCPICGCHGYNNFLRREKMLLKALILHPVWTPAGLRAGGGAHSATAQECLSINRDYLDDGRQWPPLNITFKRWQLSLSGPKVTASIEL